MPTQLKRPRHFRTVTNRNHADPEVRVEAAEADREAVVREVEQ